MDGGRILASVLRLVVAVPAVALLLAAPAAAESVTPTPPPEPPPSASAVDVYRESVPTSAGPHVVGSRGTHTAPLPPMIERRLRREGGRDAALLQGVATSSDLGAPTARRGAGAVEPRAAALPKGWAPRGLGSVASDALNGRTLILLALLAAAVIAGLILRSNRPAR